MGKCFINSGFQCGLRYDQAPNYGSHNKLNKSIHFTLICNGFLLNGLLISTLAVYLPNSVLFWRIASFLAH